MTLRGEKEREESTVKEKVSKNRRRIEDMKYPRVQVVQVWRRESGWLGNRLINFFAFFNPRKLCRHRGAVGKVGAPRALNRLDVYAAGYVRGCAVELARSIRLGGGGVG